MLTIYTPNDTESQRLLRNVEIWILALKKLNVSADIAAYMARDFLSPMRIRPLDDDSLQNSNQDLPNEQTNAYGTYHAVLEKQE